MDASYELRVILNEIAEKQRNIMLQRALILSTSPPNGEVAMERQRAIEKTTNQLEALDWAEKCVRNHLNAIGKLGKLDQKGAKID